MMTSTMLEIYFIRVLTLVFFTGLGRIRDISGCRYVFSKDRFPICLLKLTRTKLDKGNDLHHSVTSVLVQRGSN